MSATPPASQPPGSPMRHRELGESSSPGGPFQPWSSLARESSSPGPFQPLLSPARESSSPGPFQPRSSPARESSSLAPFQPWSPFQPRSSLVGEMRSRRGYRSGPSPVRYRELPLDHEEAKFCQCNPRQKAGRFISWNEYPGRRYFYCMRPLSDPQRCEFFEWHDPVFPQYITNLLGDLRDKVDELMLEVDAHKKKEKELQGRTLSYVPIDGDPTGCGCGCSNRHIVGKSSCHTGGASSPLRIVGVRSPRTRSLPGRLSDVEHLLVMAPTWPEFLVEHFVNGCVDVVNQGITIPAMTSLFYSMLGDYMRSKAKVPVTEEDLTAQFQHFRRLWGYYQKDMRSVTLGCSMESKNLKNKDATMRNLKKELDLNKYKYILKYEDQFNYIFPSRHYQKSTPICAFMYNTGSSGDISVTSNRKRSIDEPFSRQLRQKSSDVDKPESSQNGMTLDIALDELSSVASVLTYGIATQCLRDPIKLRAYSRLPTIEKKVEFLHVAWRLEYDPASALASLPPPS